MTPHLDVDVASLLTNHIEEPAQVGSSVQSQALMGDSVVGILLVICPIWRQHCTNGGYDPDLSKGSFYCQVALILQVTRYPQVALHCYKMLRNEVSAEQQAVKVWR